MITINHDVQNIAETENGSDLDATEAAARLLEGCLVEIVYVSE